MNGEWSILRKILNRSVIIYCSVWGSNSLRTEHGGHKFRLSIFDYQEWKKNPLKQTNIIHPPETARLDEVSGELPKDGSETMGTYLTDLMTGVVRESFNTLDKEGNLLMLPKKDKQLNIIYLRLNYIV